MNKLSEEQKLQNKRHAKLIVSRKARKKNKTKTCKNSIFNTSKYSNLIAPVKLSITDNERAEDTLEFINKIRGRIIEANKPAYVDFSLCDEISPDVALVLTAEAERFNIYRKGFFNCNYPKSEEAYLTLREFDFYKRARIPERKYKQSLKPMVDIIPIVSGNRAKPGHTKGQILSDIEHLFYGDEKVHDDNIEPIRDALSEALNNVGAHAYDLTVNDFLQKTRGNKKWWRAGLRDEEKKKLYLLFYDQGVGIPNTLPHKKKWKGNWASIKSIFNALGVASPPDSDVIKESTKLNISKTGELGRGNGLNQIKESIHFGQKGWLKIISNKGSYMVNSDSTEEMNDTKNSLYGTLIVWHVQLPEIINKENTARVA